MIANTVNDKSSKYVHTNDRRWEPRQMMALPEKSEQQNQILTTAKNWIGNHPVLCIGVAMTIGVTLGCLIKRQ